jgi:hypothetical protein
MRLAGERREESVWRVIWPRAGGVGFCYRDHYAEQPIF